MGPLAQIWGIFNLLSLRLLSFDHEFCQICSLHLKHREPFYSQSCRENQEAYGKTGRALHPTPSSETQKGGKCIKMVARVKRFKKCTSTTNNWGPLPGRRPALACGRGSQESRSFGANGKLGERWCLRWDSGRGGWWLTW